MGVPGGVTEGAKDDSGMLSARSASATSQEPKSSFGGEHIKAARMVHLKFGHVFSYCALKAKKGYIFCTAGNF